MIIVAVAILIGMGDTAIHQYLGHRFLTTTTSVFWRCRQFSEGRQGVSKFCQRKALFSVVCLSVAVLAAFVGGFLVFALMLRQTAHAKKRVHQ